MKEKNFLNRKDPLLTPCQGIGIPFVAPIFIKMVKYEQHTYEDNKSDDALRRVCIVFKCSVFKRKQYNTKQK